MAKYTTRDYVWNAMLKVDEAVTVEDIAKRVPSEVSEKTVRDCLNTMVEMRLLNRTNNSNGEVQYEKPTEMHIPRFE